MSTADKALLWAVGGIVAAVLLLIFGEFYLCHVDGQEFNTEILTIVKMAMTGLLALVAGRMGKERE